ncbi:MAG TPA: HAD-IB family phosphatase [Steroidobacteraceae bacterium]|nr:HAD-IB family phosphatase [Steroidobacteraceae bacterium]
MESAAPHDRRLALFDLDGTLTRHDTYLPFVLGLLARQPARWIRLLLLVLPAVGYLAGRLDRGGLKGAILHQLFKGMPFDTISTWAGRFATGAVPARLMPAALRTLQQHLAAGDHVVVLSASPDLYVPLIAQRLGVSETHCTAIRWNGLWLDGRLAGPNRRDHEKSRVLDTLRAAHPGLPVIAYGNSPADLNHMRRCEQAVYVNASPRLAASLGAEGIHCVRWR